MKIRATLCVVVATALVLTLAACQTAPVTGRRQLMLVSAEQETALGQQAFQDVLSQSTVSTDPRMNAILQRVGQRIATAAEGIHNLNYQWDFKLIESKEVNAFALPGGKVAVYTGILPVAQNEAGLAAIIGHEVSHVIARHGAERMSQDVVAQLGATAVQAGTSKLSPIAQQGIMAAFGAGTTVGVLLPYSRTQESEADRIGTEIMARAGYDPREAVALWERMSAQEQDNTPNFMRTHPKTAKRIEDLQAITPQMVEIYNSDPQRYGLGETLPAVQSSAPGPRINSATTPKGGATAVPKSNATSGATRRSGKTGTR